MNGFFIKVAEFFGAFNKIKKFLQGKKTYVINIGQALTGLSAMLAVSGQMVDLAVKTLNLIMGWGDSSQGVTDVQKAITDLWANHAVMTAAFSAGLYAVMDAFSKMSAYAASQRRSQEILGPPCPPGFIPVKEEKNEQ